MLRFGRAIVIGSFFVAVTKSAVVEPHDAGREIIEEADHGFEPVVDPELVIPMAARRGFGGRANAPVMGAAEEARAQWEPAANDMDQTRSLSDAAQVVAWVGVASTFSMTALTYLGKNAEYISRVMGADWADLAMCAFGGVSMVVSFECARGLVAANGEAFNYRQAGQMAMGFLSTLSAMAMLVAASSQGLVAPPFGGDLRAFIMQTAPELDTVVAPAVRAGSKKILNALYAVFSPENVVNALQFVRALDLHHWEVATACTVASVSIVTSFACLVNAHEEFSARRYKQSGHYLLAGIMAAFLLVGVFQAMPVSHHGAAYSTPISEFANGAIVAVAPVVQRLAKGVINSILKQ